MGSRAFQEVALQGFNRFHEFSKDLHGVSKALPDFQGSSGPFSGHFQDFESSYRGLQEVTELFQMFSGSLIDASKGFKGFSESLRRSKVIFEVFQRILGDPMFISWRVSWGLRDVARVFMGLRGFHGLKKGFYKVSEEFYWVSGDFSCVARGLN